MDSELVHMVMKDNQFRTQVTFFTREHKGEIRCNSKYPGRCSRRPELWPLAVRCLQTYSTSLRLNDSNVWLSACEPLGTGSTPYMIKGGCNMSQTPACWVTFDIDTTVSSTKTMFVYYAVICLVTMIVTMVYLKRHRSIKWQRNLFM